jgi:hypothetical protein
MAPDQHSDGRHLAEQASKEMDRIRSAQLDRQSIDPEKLSKLVNTLVRVLPECEEKHQGAAAASPARVDSLDRVGKTGI